MVYLDELSSIRKIRSERVLSRVRNAKSYINKTQLTRPEYKSKVQPQDCRISVMAFVLKRKFKEEIKLRVDIEKARSKLLKLNSQVKSRENGLADLKSSSLEGSLGFPQVDELEASMVFLEEREQILRHVLEVFSLQTNLSIPDNVLLTENYEQLTRPTDSTGVQDYPKNPRESDARADLLYPRLDNSTSHRASLKFAKGKNSSSSNVLKLPKLQNSPKMTENIASNRKGTIAMPKAQIRREDSLYMRIKEKKRQPFTNESKTLSRNSLKTKLQKPTANPTFRLIEAEENPLYKKIDLGGFIIHNPMPGAVIKRSTFNPEFTSQAFVSKFFPQISTFLPKIDKNNLKFSQFIDESSANKMRNRPSSQISLSSSSSESDSNKSAVITVSMVLKDMSESGKMPLYSSVRRSAIKERISVQIGCCNHTADCELFHDSFGSETSILALVWYQEADKIVGLKVIIENSVAGTAHAGVQHGRLSTQVTRVQLSKGDKLLSLYAYSDDRGIKGLKIITLKQEVFEVGVKLDTVDDLESLNSVEINNALLLTKVSSCFKTSNAALSGLSFEYHK